MKPTHAPHALADGRAAARLTLRVVSRRDVLAGAAASAAALGLPACAEEYKGENALPEAIPPITPNAEFYVTSCHGTPEVDGAAWSLGVFDRGVEVARVDLAGLEALEAREKEHTLECIGASYYHLAIGNAVWTGVPLVELLATLGVTPPAEAVELVITGADGYDTSLPVADLDLPVWIVWRMNGEPLPPEHGYPARLLVPGRYGMKNPKWVVELEFVDAPHTGFWEEQGWSNDASYKPNAMIHAPPRTRAHVVAGPVRVLGTAFAGDDPVVRVEVRVDDGAWEEAVLDYAPGADVWTLWHVDLELTEGAHVVRARCVTASGAESGEPGGSSPLEGYDGSMEIELEVG